MQDSVSMFLSASDSVKVWDAEHMRTLRQYNCHDSSSGSNFKDVAWNYDNTELASVSTTGGIVLYDWASSGGNNNINYRELSESTEQTSVCFGHTGSSLFSGGTTGDINLWNCKTGKRVKTFNECHQSPVKRIDKIAEDKVVSACAAGEIIVWKIESGSVCTKLKASKPQSVRGLEQSPWVTTTLGTTSDDGAVHIWNTEKQATKHVFTSHDAPAMDLSFSPLNHLLLSSCGLDKKVIFYDIQGNNVVKTINSSQPLTAVCFLSNGVHVCAGSSMGNIYKYDLRKAEEPLYSIHAHSTSIQRLVSQTSKQKYLRKSSRTSRSSSSKQSGQKTQKKDTQQKDELKPSASEKFKSNAKSPQDHAKNRRSWSNKVPDIEVSSNEIKPINGDGIMSPTNKIIPGRNSQLEKNIGLQTPANRSVASIRRDTMGSYCEGIFSPVASVNDSIQDDAAFIPANPSQNKPQRTSRGSLLPNSGFIHPITRNSANRLPSEQNGEINKAHTPFTREEESTARGSISGQLGRGSRSDTRVNHSTPLMNSASAISVNGATASNSSLSPTSENASGKLRPQSEDSTLNDFVNGGAVTDASSTPHLQPDYIQSNPFQYQLDFLQNTVQEMVEEHEDNIRDELRHLHLQLIKMFAEQNERIRQLAEQSSVNPLLLQEIERLRIENDRLRRKY
uniref:protein NEDD1-like n=1 Tax=Styela clava TaxID=7725 RepID=UPI00193975B3|nr:protein NEDD1-like [Styela clava]